LPAHLREHLKRRYLDTVAHNLYLLHHLRYVAERFHAAHIPFVVLKGLAVAATVYEDWGQREATDVDILMPDVAIPYATHLLREAGFEQEASGVIASQGKGIQANASGFARRDAEGRIFMIDLHWTPTPRYFQVRWVTDLLLLRRTEYQVGDIRMPVLSHEDRLLVPCAHGCKHTWERLRFVVDIAKLLQREGHRLDWTYVWEQAARSGITRMVALGIYLAYRLLHAPVASEHVRIFHRYPGLEKAFLLVCRRLFQEDEQRSSVWWQELAFHAYIRPFLHKALGSWYHMGLLAFQKRFSLKHPDPLPEDVVAPASDERVLESQALPV